jgi:sphinganine C4-monooxygenase
MIIILLPIIIYWSFCLFIYLFGLDNDTEINNISKSHVIKQVLSLHFLQIITQIINLYININNSYQTVSDIYTFRFLYIIFGIFLIDTIQYFIHRIQHIKFIYIRTHKKHHELIIPWSFGAVYNSIGESIIVGLIILLFFQKIFDFSLLEFNIVNTLAYIATILQHTSLNISHSKYHLIHHKLNYKYNFQQPFFSYWDRLFGTYMDPSDIEINKKL